MIEVVGGIMQLDYMQSVGWWGLQPYLTILSLPPSLVPPISMGLVEEQITMMIVIGASSKLRFPPPYPINTTPQTTPAKDITLCSEL
jgi:hypothetical protein